MQISARRAVMRYTELNHPAVPGGQHRQNTISIVHLIVGLVVIITSVTCKGETGNIKRPPNVVFILADDLGWSDTSLYGTTNFYRTPNIQRLAQRGMTFTRAYSASPLCSPTRASILTGLAPARHGITAPNCHTPTVRLKASIPRKGGAKQNCIQPNPVTRLDPKTLTLAERLKADGFSTGHFGKWHLGAEPFSPLEHGFDVDIPHWHGPGPAGSYVAPWAFEDFDHDPDIPDEHIEDRMAKEAVAYIQAHKDEPFFLNYWMFSVHAPFDAKKRLIEKYAKQTNRSDEQRCPTYAAMVESMDDAVGTLINELDRLNLSDNTIIVFTSDNGGNMYNLVDGERPTSNRPLRGGKATMYEGGVRTPAVIVMPGRVPKASTCDTIVQSMDFYPTILELLELPSKEDQVFDGVSLLPAFDDKPLDREGIFTYFPHNPPVPDWLPPSISVHSGDWKLIRLFHAGKSGGHRYKLFNLRDDVGESDDLSKTHARRVLELDRLIEKHLQATNAVQPAANESFDPDAYEAENEGKPAPKFLPDYARRSVARGKRPAPVSGWRAGGTCQLSVEGVFLHIKSDGRDPYLSCRLDRPYPPGNYTLTLRMRSDSNGNGQVFWTDEKRPFGAGRSQTFRPNHNGMSQNYVISFTSEEPIQSIRIDPSRDTGSIDLTKITLGQGGRPVREWQFK